AVLKAKGYSCITSPGSLEALKLLSSNHEVGIVLLDMMMPDMDGYEMLTTLRKGSNADLPVIAVTAQAMLGDREKCLAAGADDYVSKPVDIDKLVDILDKYLQK
ncbi:MAG TPA: response regulator, partial [Cyclobacteriaceae bacterium]|nr:response regulator [Cyclobacteriaceae bacterium]